MADMTDQEKSVLLAKAMGGEPDTYPLWILDFKESRVLGGETNLSTADYVFNLYDPGNMALAWRVLNWGGGPGLDELMCMWFCDEELILVPPADAQRVWLDKILELAIEAGIIELSEELAYKYFGDVRPDDL